MEELKERIRSRYAGLDSTVLSHGQDYFLTASKIYKNLESNNTFMIYPLLTLLGMSAELFLKAFNVNVNEQYVNGSMVSKTVEPRHYSHNLKELLERYIIQDEDLFSYLIMSYNNNAKRDLLKDLSKYSMIFVQSRYIFQYKENKYIKDIDIIFNLVKSLYNSINNLYKD